MRPESGRMVLEAMDDVQIAEQGILLYYKAIKKENMLGVRLAKSESELPIALSKNQTSQIQKALDLIMESEVEIGPLTPAVAQDWKDRLEGRVVPDLGEHGDISVSDMRPQRPAVDQTVGNGA